jgi:hypothetical protein
MAYSFSRWTGEDGGTTTLNHKAYRDSRWWPRRYMTALATSSILNSCPVRAGKLELDGRTIVLGVALAPVFRRPVRRSIWHTSNCRLLNRNAKPYTTLECPHFGQCCPWNVGLALALGHGSSCNWLRLRLVVVDPNPSLRVSHALSVPTKEGILGA